MRLGRVEEWEWEWGGEGGLRGGVGWLGGCVRRASGLEVRKRVGELDAEARREGGLGLEAGTWMAPGTGRWGRAEARGARHLVQERCRRWWQRRQAGAAGRKRWRRRQGRQPSLPSRAGGGAQVAAGAMISGNAGGGVVAAAGWLAWRGARAAAGVAAAAAALGGDQGCRRRGWHGEACARRWGSRGSSSSTRGGQVVGWAPGARAREGGTLTLGWEAAPPGGGGVTAGGACTPTPHTN